MKVGSTSPSVEAGFNQFTWASLQLAYRTLPGAEAECLLHRGT